MKIYKPSRGNERGNNHSGMRRNWIIIVREISHLSVFVDVSDCFAAIFRLGSACLYCGRDL